MQKEHNGFVFNLTSYIACYRVEMIQWPYCEKFSLILHFTKSFEPDNIYKLSLSQNKFAMVSIDIEP